MSHSLGIWSAESLGYEKRSFDRRWEGSAGLETLGGEGAKGPGQIAATKIGVVENTICCA